MAEKERVNNSEKIILHLCAKEGSDSLPYRNAGYDVRIIGEDIGVENYTPLPQCLRHHCQSTMHDVLYCQDKSKDTSEPSARHEFGERVLRIVWECQYRITKISFENAPLKFWCLENPASGYLKWFLGHPAFTYNQMEYGMGFSKSTALWGLFNLPKCPLLFNQPAKGKYLGNWAPNHDKDGKRSACPIDFAKAFYEANP